MEDDTWSAYICDLVDYVAGGGIVTASAHWANPSGNLGDTYDTCRGVLGYDNSREAYEQAFTDLLTKGTEYNDAFMSELEDEARFLKALKDNGVSIIWRPLHEANGNWFWFCHGGYGFDTKYIVDIWHYVYDYFTEEWGLDNLIWCFAPNVSTAESVMSLYPGDEYCDMVGVDWYTSGNLEIANDNNYLHLTDLSRKPGAITEFGTSATLTAEDPADQIDLYNAMTFYDEIYDLVEDGYSFTYVITWYNRYGITYLGLGDELMEQEMTLNQSEVKAIFESIK
jgi:mannan endo-1,4-beta-mannosidase